MFDDGIIRIGIAHERNIFDPTKDNKTYIEFILETRLIDFNDEDDNDDHGLFLPFEMRIRTERPFNDGASNASIEEIKAGIIRGVFNSAGITLQAGSYVFENLENQYGKVHALEIMSLTFNGAFDLVSEKKLELIVKGFVNIGVSPKARRDKRCN